MRHRLNFNIMSDCDAYYSRIRLLASVHNHGERQLPSDAEVKCVSLFRLATDLPVHKMDAKIYVRLSVHHDKKNLIKADTERT